MNVSEIAMNLWGLILAVAVGVAQPVKFEKGVEVRPALWPTRRNPRRSRWMSAFAAEA